MKGIFSRSAQKSGRMESMLISSATCDCSCLWAFWPFTQEQKAIPRDVPKGHLVVYVGENYNRYVINITLLKHPLFKALLDQAREEYDFEATLKLCIPCDDEMFLSVVRCATSPKDRGISMYRTICRPSFKSYREL